MPVARYSAKIDSDGNVRVIHIFLGPNDAAVDALQEKHADGCKAYGPAFQEDNTIDLDEDVDTLPQADEESLCEFLGLAPPEGETEDVTGGEEDEDEEEEDEEEEDEEEEDEEEK